MKRTFRPACRPCGDAGPSRMPAAAQEGTLKKIKDSGSITIGHRDASMPVLLLRRQAAADRLRDGPVPAIVDAVKAELKMPKLEVKYQLVTSANRIPLMANGTIDLECGSTTNNIARQEQVWFTITHFVTANRWVAKKSSNIEASSPTSRARPSSRPRAPPTSSRSPRSTPRRTSA